MSTKYVSGRVKELKVGVSNYSESKESLSVIGIVSATKYYGDGSNLTGAQIPGVDPSGSSSFNNLKVTGISTFEGDLDIESSVLITGITTIGGLVDINAGGQANTFKVEDLTDNRVVIAGTGGELEDSANLTFDGTTFNVGSGVTVYQATGIVSATKFYGDGSSLTGIDASSLSFGGAVKAQANASGVVVTGVLTATTFSGALTGNADTATTAGTVTTAAQPNITSVGTLTAVTVSGDITANGNIVGDTATNISGIASVTATTFYGNGSGLTNLQIPGVAPAETSTFKDLNVTGVSTFAGNINANGNIVGDNSTNITGIAGVTATTLTGTLQTAAQPNVTSLGTIASLVANSAKISDLTDNRVVIVGTSGELEDTTKLTFDGSTLTVVGDASFTGNVSVAGTLTSEDKTNIDSIGIVTARTGVRIDSGGLVVTSGVATFTDAIDANGGANVDGGLVANSAKISDLTSGRVVVAGTAGELEDASTFTFSGGTVTATKFVGDGSSLTGITASGTGAIGGLTIKDESAVVGTAGSVSTLDFKGSYITAIATAGAAGVATVTVSATPTFTSVNVTGIVTAANFNSTSDAKLKDNVKIIENPLDKIIKIDGVSFTWKEDNSPSLGVIADTVEKVLPELVSKTDPKTVNYNGLIGLLIEAVKEQQIQINELKSKLS